LSCTRSIILIYLDEFGTPPILKKKPLLILCRYYLFQFDILVMHCTKHKYLFEKNYLLITIGDNGLSDLMVIANEKEEADTLDLNEAVDSFTKLKSRRFPLL